MHPLGGHTTSRRSFWTNPEFIGPAAVVNAHRVLFDSRDRACVRIPLEENFDLRVDITARAPRDLEAQLMSVVVNGEILLSALFFRHPGSVLDPH